MDTGYLLEAKLSVLQFLGPNLYGNIPAVLSEMVANAWDADATRVDILVDKDKQEIEIEDNGLGISPSDINDKYLSVGYDKRKNKADRITKLGRHVMGRKGIGKLAIFSLAKTVEIHSSHEKGKSGFILKWDDIEKLFDHSQYSPISLNPKDVFTTCSTGTRLILRGVEIDKLDFPQEENKMRMQLARRFVVLDKEHNFDVYINGTQITNNDRPYFDSMEFVWYLGKKFSQQELCKKIKQSPISLPNSFKLDDNTQVKIKGWVGTVDTPKAVTNDKNNVISIYANGKLVHEDILSSYNEIKARTFATYLIGDIEADFLDDDEQTDIVIANRREVNADDPRFVTLKKFILENILLRIGARWSTMRNLMQIDQRLMTEEIQDRYDKLNKRDQEKASSYLKRLSKIELQKEDAQNLAILIFEHLNSLKKVKGLISLSDASFLKELKPLDPDNITKNNSSREERRGENSPDTFERNQPQESPKRDLGNQSEAYQQKDEMEGPGKESTSSETYSNDQQANDQTRQDQDTDAHNWDNESSPIFDLPEGIEQFNGSAFRRISPPERERETLFGEIKNTISNSKVRADLKEIALYDLSEAYWAYRTRAFKASCIMLGAVLEGLMISVTLDSGVLSKCKGSPNPPKKIKEFCCSTPSITLDELAKLIQDRFSFEDYKVVINFLLQNSGEANKSKINEIQVFRNIIHPLKNISGIDAYKKVDPTRAIDLLSSMAIICKTITEIINKE